MEKRAAKLEKLKRLILPACMFGFCVALYFSTAPNRADTAADIESGAVYAGDVSAHSFAQNAQRNGLTGELTLNERTADSMAYTIACEADSEAQLLLYMDNGAVYASELIAVRPMESVDGSVVKAELLMGCTYDEHMQWLLDCTSALIRTFSINASDAEADSLISDLRAALMDGERWDAELNGITVALTTDDAGSPALIHIHIESA